ncbi:MAG: Crp/Fnr family transcriptional regulator [Bacteroidales bacterium]|nr:Crp/Fnr family transcriptional regulator [Bacteroidales bacterium]HOY39814.1 Crp/Fnr family transcriptional regulator [Bacteroidales bacterium]HQP05109.1 Crp/Fnr family transcriptional regulator [Bacteroidales bacterium]
MQKEINFYQLLSNTPFFGNLDETSVMKLLASVHYQLKSYNKGDIIVHKNDVCEWFMLVTSGSVRGEMSDPEGKVLKIENVMAGHTIALAFLFGRNARYPVTVVANENSQIFRILKQDLIKMLQKSRELLETMLILVSERTQFLTGRIHFLSLKTIKGKLSFYILQRVKPNSQFVYFERNQTELSEFFGVARPSLARALKQLEEDGCIEVKGKSVKILNLQLLKSLSH